MSRARLSRTATTCIKEGQDVVTGGDKEHQAERLLRAAWGAARTAVTHLGRC